MSDVTRKVITFIIIMLVAIAAIVGCVYVLQSLVTKAVEKKYFSNYFRPFSGTN